MNGIRALVACLDAVASDADAPVADPRIDLRDLVGEEVSAVEPHPHGWRMRFGSGSSIVVCPGATFDAAGTPVIEP